MNTQQLVELARSGAPFHENHPNKARGDIFDRAGFIVYGYSTSDDGFPPRLENIFHPIRPHDPAAVAIAALNAVKELADERDAALALLNTPELRDFASAVVREAAHQRSRWPAGHDANKAPADWFWLIGWLAGKAVHATTDEKRLHHIITAAAACANWHAHEAARDTAMVREERNGK